MKKRKTKEGEEKRKKKRRMEFRKRGRGSVEARRSAKPERHFEMARKRHDNNL